MRSADHQLLFPWGKHSETVLRKGQLRGALDADDICYELRAAGPKIVLEASMELEALPGRREHLQVHIDVGKDPDCWIASLGTFEEKTTESVWNMCELDVGTGPFAEATSWATRRLFGWQKEMQVWRRPKAHSHWVAICRQAAIEALQRCEPRARDTALAFHADVRFFVYSAVVRYGRWVAQCARVCPGVFVLLSVVARSRCPGPVLRSIASGEKLVAVIDKTLELWTEVRRQMDEEAATVHMKFYRSLVRRAPVELAPSDLAFPAPHGMDANDIPRADERARLLWYRTVLALSQARRFCALSASAQRSLAGFVSRHGVALARDASERRTCAEVVFDELVDYCARSGGPVPCRRTPCESALSRVIEWHLNVACSTTLPLETQLEQAAMAEPRLPLRVTPVRSISALFQEGESMGHCVGSYADEAAMSGRLYFFSIDYTGERLTAAIKGSRGSLWIDEVAGHYNRHPSAEALRAIREWVSESNELELS